MKRFRIAILILLVPFLTQCGEDREQRMLFDAAERTEKDNPSAHFTEEAFALVIRYKPGTELARQAQDKIELITKLRERR